MNLQDINWEFSAAGTWPRFIKVIIIVLICSIVIGAWYYFDTLEQWEGYKKIEKKEAVLRSEFEVKQKKAVNLPAYREQLKQIEVSLTGMLRQLPTKQEVDSLLIDISQTGLASGLEFQLFQPRGIIQRDFYNELPINIKVTGRFEEFGLFVSGLASLPRIVTVHNVRIQNKSKKSGSSLLNMAVQVKTYSDVGGSVASKPKKKRRKGKR